MGRSYPSPSSRIARMAGKPPTNSGPELCCKDASTEQM